MNLEYLVGLVAVSMTLGAFGYQLYKFIHTKDTTALSYHLMIWVGASMFLYVIFGFFYLDEPIIYIGNAVGVIINIALIITKWSNEHK